MQPLPSSPRIVILTGAGISAESGLSTFRDKDGIWSKVRIEDVATPEAFQRDPIRVLGFYRQRIQAHSGVMPNPAHLALAKLARELPSQVLLITQNIDTLHEDAGAPSVLHMHGRIFASLCHSCKHRWQDGRAWHERDDCPACGAPHPRPDVVWFGETPYGMETIDQALQECEMFVAIGTSGSVYPAAGFVLSALESGASTLELNLEPSENRAMFGEARYGPASKIIPEWVEEMLRAPAADGATQSQSGI